MPTFPLFQTAAGAETSTTSTGAGATIPLPPRKFAESTAVVQVLFSSGSSCTWKIQGKASGVNSDWTDILTPTANDSGAYAIVPMDYMRINVTAISGTTVYGWISFAP